MNQYGPEIWIASDLMELAQEGAKRIIDAAKKAIAIQRRFTMVLSGGQTPKYLYQVLATHRELDWSKVEFFFGDERMVPWDHPESNYRLAKETLFDPLKIAPSQIHAIPTHLSVLQAALAYEMELKDFLEKQGHPFDLVLLGLGSDGHTASIFPSDPIFLEKRPAALCIPVLYAPKPPLERVSMTHHALNQARQIFVLVSGKEKAAAVCAALESDAEPAEVPIRAIIPMYGKIIWLIDRLAACALTQASG